MIRTARTFLLALAMLSVSTSDASAGQFKDAVYYHAGQLPYQVVAAHLTDSGNLDLVIANLTSQIFVLLGNGDGTFQQPISYQFQVPLLWP